MTVAATVPKIIYTYAGPGSYSFSFQIKEDTDITVHHIDGDGIPALLVLNSDYTISTVPGVDGGDVVLTYNVTVGGTLSVERVLPITQETEWVNGNPFDMNILEADLDRLIMIVQQLNIAVEEGSITTNWTGDWVTAKEYFAPELVGAPNTNWYQCIVPHTSGVWADDLAAGYWSLALNLLAVQTIADAAAASAAAALVSENAAAASAASTEADAVQTALDAVATAADVLLTAADAVSTAADVVSTAANAVIAVDAAAVAVAAAANLPNATTAGVDKFLQTNAAGDGWIYHTASEARVALGVGTTDSPTFAGQTLTGPQTLKVGAAIASAATVDASSATGNTVHITGTVATSAVVVPEGRIMRFIADAAWPLTYHATTNRINTGGVDHTLEAGDEVLYYYDGTTVFGWIRKKSGQAVAPTDTNTIVQVVSYQTGAVATGTTQLPQDDTIPQNTEGDEYMTLAITPTSATNKLEITVNAMFANSASGRMILSLFQDTTANAIAVSELSMGAIGVPASGCLTHTMVSGTTSATTFKLRAGTIVAGTTTFNGVSGGRLFGGVAASSIVIKEIAV